MLIRFALRSWYKELSRMDEVQRMFLKNSWYCAGWDYQLGRGRDDLLARRIAGEPIVLYRRLDGSGVAMEDRCCHRQAALHLGRIEGDCLRCMYHGMKFGPDGKCVEVPGQNHIPAGASVRTYPVVEKNNWIWVWMGDPAKADPGRICFAVGPGDPGWNIRTSQMSIKTNYRLEIANLVDLSHATWTHRKTLGGTDKWVTTKLTHTMTECGINSTYWMRSVPPPTALQHLFPPGMLVDAHVDVDVTLPCNFVIHFKVFSAGTATEGPSDGQLVLDSYSCQAVTPVDEGNLDYYYSWGPSVATDQHMLAETLIGVLDAAFAEDKAVLEAQYRNWKERPDARMINIVHDAGPEKMLRLLDRLLAEEAAEEARPVGMPMLRAHG
jgi:vanillate O-demethylase monooxygenase subunit